MSVVAAVDEAVTVGTRVIFSSSTYQLTMEAEMVMPKRATAKKVVRQLRTRNEGISCKHLLITVDMENTTSTGQDRRAECSADGTRGRKHQHAKATIDKRESAK